MIAMTLELAEKIAHAAHQKSTEFNRPISVAIVDESGRLVYYSRGNGAGFLTFDTAKAKAVVAASFKRSTVEINETKNANPLLWYSLASVIPSQALPSPGGLPLIKDNHIIGAIGIGGGLPEEDHDCALAGSAVISE